MLSITRVQQCSVVHSKHWQLNQQLNSSTAQQLNSSTAQQLNSSTAQQGKLFDLKKITPM
jgi:hypothetical protein